MATRGDNGLAVATPGARQESWETATSTRRAFVIIGAYRPEHLIPIQTANDCSHS